MNSSFDLSKWEPVGVSLGIYEPTPLPDSCEHSKSFSLLENQVPETMEKPKRPLSAYNLFFQSERKALLASLPEPIGRNGKKRSSKKSHGKIGFKELATAISQRWKDADGPTRAHFYGLANVQKLAYHEATKP